MQMTIGQLKKIISDLPDQMPVIAIYIGKEYDDESDDPTIEVDEDDGIKFLSIRH